MTEARPDSSSRYDPEAGSGHARRSLFAFLRVPANVIALVVVAIAVLMALVPANWLPYEPTRIDVIRRLQPPTWSLAQGDHPFGTDVLGRDMFSRLVYAARWTLIVTFGAAALACVVGVTAGLTAGYYGGSVDSVISRLIDMQLAFPVVLLALAVLAVAGPSLTNMVLVLAFVDWARYARVVRAAVLLQRTSQYVEAAGALGAGHVRIMAAHVLPNIVSTIVVMTTFSASLLLLTESALSFLGLGVAPPAVTWGAMIGGGRDYVFQAWWIATIPGVAITLLVLALNWIGDGLRDAFDPREV